MSDLALAFCLFIILTIFALTVLTVGAGLIG